MGTISTESIAGTMDTLDIVGIMGIEGTVDAVGMVVLHQCSLSKASNTTEPLSICLSCQQTPLPKTTGKRVSHIKHGTSQF